MRTTKTQIEKCKRTDNSIYSSKDLNGTNKGNKSLEIEMSKNNKTRHKRQQKLNKNKSNQPKEIKDSKT